MGAVDCHLDLSRVPLFPLPNVVLFPRAVLPLHIFEERYKAMTADALRGSRQVAMALLRDGWEKNYYGRPAIEPVVCVGTIASHERLSDGTYNFLLQGHTRARVVRERPPDELPYRVAELAPIAQSNVLEIDLSEQRERLTFLFNDGPLARVCLARQFRSLLERSGACIDVNRAWSTPDIVDLMAFTLLDDVVAKQPAVACRWRRAATSSGHHCPSRAHRIATT
jgi:Lon protease-like protein